MIGYKAFNSDLTCRNFQYKIGNTYKIDEKPKLCENGFHFCKELTEVFKYYPFIPLTRVCRVNALGLIDADNRGKYCTNQIKIIEEVDTNKLFQFHYCKKTTSNNFDLSSVRVGSGIKIRNHILRCVHIDDYKYIFAFDKIMTTLPIFRVHDYISNLENFIDWLPQEWLDNISEIFIPTIADVFEKSCFTYYKKKSNRIKFNIQRELSYDWWLSSIVHSAYFARVTSYGNAYYSIASIAYGLAPHFRINKNK